MALVGPSVVPVSRGRDSDLGIGLLSHLGRGDNSPDVLGEVFVVKGLLAFLVSFVPQDLDPGFLSGESQSERPAQLLLLQTKQKEREVQLQRVVANLKSTTEDKKHDVEALEDSNGNQNKPAASRFRLCLLLSLGPRGSLLGGTPVRAPCYKSLIPAILVLVFYCQTVRVGVDLLQ